MSHTMSQERFNAHLAQILPDLLVQIDPLLIANEFIAFYNVRRYYGNFTD